MKTATIKTKMLALAALIIAVQGVFAQASDQKNDVHAYRLHIVRDDNGNKEVIDKTFATKDEMDAYLKDSKIDAGDELELSDSAWSQNTNNDKQNNKKEKKIIIIEKDESGLNKDIDLEIGTQMLSEEERLNLIQQLLEIKGAKLRVIQISKTTGMGKSESINNQATQAPTACITAGAANNLSGVKVYPNPNTGQFHVAFSVNEPSAVKVRITDLQGKELLAYSLSNYSGNFDKDIYRPGLSVGTYLLDIEAGGEKETTKVVMQ